MRIELLDLCARDMVRGVLSNGPPPFPPAAFRGACPWQGS